MLRLDHLALDVGDVARVRDWYCSVLGLDVEFDAGPRVGLQDESGFTLILQRADGPPTACTLYFQVDDVEATHAELVGRGIEVAHPPRDNPWGFGCLLTDPEGRGVGLWDEASMARHVPAGDD